MRGMFLFVSLRPAGELYHQVAVTEFADFVRATGVVDCEHRIIAGISDEVGDVSGFAGVIVGGSSLNVTNDAYDAYQVHVHRQLRLLVDAATPVFFICFGAGWLADATGGRVDRSHAETSGASVVELLPAALSDPVCGGLPDRFVGLTGHTESIAEVGPGVTVLASGPTCPVQLFRWGGNKWASQFHCEMDAAAMEARMRFFIDYGYFSRADFASIVASLGSVDVRWAHRVLQNFISYCLSERVADVAVFAS